jgi:type II secretory pathway pseudopilin PulG
MLAGRRRARQARRRGGMTLIELVLAVGLMAIVATVAFLSYDAAVRAWRAGTELSNSLHQGDYIMEQVVMGLRSAYWRAAPGYGFMLTDGGEGASARDSIRWVKLGTALIGADTPYAGMPHAVELAVGDVTDAAGKMRTGLTVRSWRLDLQQSDFDVDKVPAVLLSTRVVGLNCRTLDNSEATSTLGPVSGIKTKSDLKWNDDWATSNRLPYAVEITLFVQPPQEGEQPVEMKRIVRLPMAAQSWGR